MGRGRKRKDRVSIAKAFIAKSVYHFETTDILIEYLRGCKNLRRLCGWEYIRNVPSKSTFSRAFAEFADGNLAQIIHEAMVKKHLGDKLAGHVSRDSTAIKAREKPVKNEKARKDTPKRKRGRPRKGEKVQPKPPKKLDLQPKRSLESKMLTIYRSNAMWEPRKTAKGTKKAGRATSFIWIVLTEIFRSVPF